MPCVRVTPKCSRWTSISLLWCVSSAIFALFQLGRLLLTFSPAGGRVALPSKSLALSVMFRLLFRLFAFCPRVIRWLMLCRDKNFGTLFVAPPSPTLRLNCYRSTCPLCLAPSQGIASRSFGYLVQPRISSLRHQKLVVLVIKSLFLRVDIQTIVQALKMLSSSDPVVANIAKAELRQSVRFAARNNPTVSLINDFLSGSSTGNFHPNRTRYRTHSLWTVIILLNNYVDLLIM